MDSHKYLDTRNTQAGLEVGIDPDPFKNPHAGWPDPNQSVWGNSSKPSSNLSKLGTSPDRSTEKIYLGNGESSKAVQARRILGLSVGMFWAMIVLLFCILAGGIGGGIGAGLAFRKDARKDACLR